MYLTPPSVAFTRFRRPLASIYVIPVPPWISVIAVSQAVARIDSPQAGPCQSRSSTSSARWPALASHHSTACPGMSWWPPRWMRSGASMRWSAGRSPSPPACSTRRPISWCCAPEQGRGGPPMMGRCRRPSPGTMPNIRQPPGSTRQSGRPSPAPLTRSTWPWAHSCWERRP